MSDLGRGGGGGGGGKEGAIVWETDCGGREEGRSMTETGEEVKA